MSTTAIDLIETERMSFERLRADHGPELAVLLHDPRVGRTLWTRPEPPSETELAVSLEAKVEHWNRHGFGLWLMRDRSTGEMVGRGGMQHTLVTGEIEIEVGWAIVPERWGQGLATELAIASVEVAFGTLGLLEVIAFALPDNIASLRVMEKAGFVYQREVEHVGRPHVLCRRRRRDG